MLLKNLHRSWRLGAHGAQAREKDMFNFLMFVLCRDVQRVLEGKGLKSQEGSFACRAGCFTG